MEIRNQQLFGVPHLQASVGLWRRLCVLRLTVLQRLASAPRRSA